MPNRHFGKFYLLSGSLVRLVFALVAKIAAVVLLHLLSAPAPLRSHARADSIGTSTREHTAIFFAILQGMAGLTRRLEIFGGDRGWDGR
jgi:hypothetical protein